MAMFRTKAGGAEIVPAASGAGHYINFTPMAGCVWIPTRAKEELFEPIPDKEPTPPAAPNSESWWRAYAHACAAVKKDGGGATVIGWCFARSENEAYGIAFKRYEAEFPDDEWRRRVVVVSQIPGDMRKS